MAYAADGTTANAAPLPAERRGFVMVTLADGRALVVGGDRAAADGPQPPGSAVVYNPVTGTWTPTAPYAGERRVHHTATLLADGRVLVSGGRWADWRESSPPADAVYDPAADTWTTIAEDPAHRYQAAAARLLDGRVLVVGGHEVRHSTQQRSISTASVFDPASGTWARTGDLGDQHSGTTVVVEPGGTALAAGGGGTRPVERWDPVTGQWTAAPVDVGHETASLSEARLVPLPGGAALVSVYGGVAVVDASGTWRKGASPRVTRRGATLTVLPSGEVLAAGGVVADHRVPDAAEGEFYDPRTDLWRDATLGATRSGAQAVVVGGGDVLLVGGTGDGRSAERFTPPPGPVAPAQDNTPAAALEAHAARESVAPGEPVALSGRLTTRATDDPVAGEQVRLYARAAGAAAWTLTGTATTDAEGMAAFQVTPGPGTTRYALRHAASAAAGAAASGDLAVTRRAAPTPPEPPERALVQGGDGTARVQWLPPVSDGGSPVTGYVIRAFRPWYGPGPAAEVTTGPGARSATLTGLASPETYEVYVVAKNAHGEGAGAGGRAYSRPGAPAPAPARTGGTKACGRLPFGTTTWTAAGSPYHVCELGVIVPVGSALVVDGAEARFQAPVDPHVPDRYGVMVRGGGFRATGATLRGEDAGRGQWAGVHGDVYDGHHVPTVAASGVRRTGTALRLTGSVVRHAVDAVAADTTVAALRLSGTTIAEASGDGFRARTAAYQLSDVTVEDVGGAGVRGICNWPYHSDTRPLCSVRIDGLRVDRAGGTGVHVHTPAPVSVRDVEVTRSGTTAPVHEAARFSGMRAAYGAGGDIEDVRGGGNAIDAVLLRFTSTRDLVWRTPAVTPAAAPAPLGFLTGGITLADGQTVTFPAGSVVKGVPRREGDDYCHEPYAESCAGGIVLRGGVLDASVPGSVFTSAADDAAGVQTCPSALATACGDGGWGGLFLGGAGARATVNGAAFRHGGIEVDGWDTTAPHPVVAVTATTFADAAHGIRAEGYRYSNDGEAPRGSLAVTGVTMTDVDQPLTATRVASVTVDGLSVAGAGQGVWVAGDDWSYPEECVRRSAASLRDVAVDGVLGTGLRLDGLCHPEVQGVSVRGSRGSAGYYDEGYLVPAVRLSEVTASVGPGGDVHGLTGGGNELDAVSIAGTVTGGLEWVSPYNAAEEHPLGYVVGDHGHWYGGLGIRGGDLVVPEDGVVAFGRPVGNDAVGPRLTLYGGSLDASAGGARFVGAQDPLVPQLGCGPRVGCRTTRWGDVNVWGAQDHTGHWGKGQTGDVRLADATFRGGGLLVTSQEDRAGAIVSLTGVDSDSRMAMAKPVRAVVTGSRAPAFRIAGARSAEVSGNTAYGTTADGKEPVGILLTGRGAATSTDVVLRDNAASGTSGPGFALSGARVTVGPGGTVDGNTGAGTAAVLAFAGVVTAADLAWVSPTTEPAPHPVGYVVSRVGEDSYGTGLTVDGDHTLTLPRGAVVKTDGALGVSNGARIDGTAGGAVITSIYDTSVGVATCQGPYRHINDSQPCGPAGTWGQVVGGTGGVALTGARVLGAVRAEGAAAAAPGAPGFGLALDRTHVQGSVLADGTPARITHSRVGGNWEGVRLARSAGNVVRDLLVEDVYQTGLDLHDAQADVRETVLRRTARQDTPVEVFAAVRVRGTSGGTFSCLDVSGNHTGVAALGQPLTVTDSVLTGNTTRSGNYSLPRYDLHNEADVTTTGVWWGQPGGPVPGQVRDAARHTDTAPAASAPACATADAAVPPSAPKDPAAAAGPQRATVTWAAPDTDGGSPVTGYRVTASPGGASVVAAGTARTATVTGLTDGTAYTFTVTATNAAGEGPPARATEAVRPAPVAPTALTASAPAVVTYGTAVALTGRLTSGGAGLAGKPLQVHVRSAGSVEWGAAVATLTTSATGHVSYPLNLRATADVRLSYAGDDATAAATAPPRTVVVRPVVTLTVSDASVAPGTAVTLTTRVSPNLAGRPVTLERYTSRGWQPVSTATLSATSGYRFTVRWRTRGTYSYRVVSPASAEHARAVSPTRRLVVG
jgi:hypothetical protein